MAAGMTEKLWSMDDVCQMMDAVAPKPGPRGSYKKRSVENSNRDDLNLGGDATIASAP